MSESDLYLALFVVSALAFYLGLLRMTYTGRLISAYAIWLGIYAAAGFLGALPPFLRI